ncbi:DUF4248 domain-containing protein [Labilibacter sediminis]|nr:DUF4248 domain-containing protein [Labilibacter sediminis]
MVLLLLLFISLFYNPFVVAFYFSIIESEKTQKGLTKMIFRRTILKQDLAIKLYPQSSNINAAMQLLRKEIKLSPELNNRLELLTRNKRAHYYTHKELEAILEHFCISQQEFELL